MSYFKPFYLFFFFPLVILGYYLLPKRVKPLYLLFCSYVFFFLISKKLILFVFLSSLSIYLAGIWMKKMNERRDCQLQNMEKEEKKIFKEKYKQKKKLILIGTILFNLSFLFFFKYLNFFMTIVNKVFQFISIDISFPWVKRLAPIGISFYTLQAISYLIDVYREKIKPEDNLFKVMLYLSFFPTIMEGPIARYTEVKDDIYQGKKITYHNLCFGYQRILYGLFKKLIIADRLNIFVKLAFQRVDIYSGATLALGVIFYTIMLYMEFSGTMDVVIGSAEVFDIKLPENFRQPFFSKNISEFWSRWHITLGLWFKDYIFYPVSLSKPVKKLSTSVRKKMGNKVSSLLMGAIALFAVWSLNGLWHGAGWTFIFFGYYHFILILLGNIFTPYIIKLCEVWHINRKSFFYQFFQIIKTTILVFIGELFFKAPTLTVAFTMIRKIFTQFSVSKLSKEILKLGLDSKDFIIILLALLVVFVISLFKERGFHIRQKIEQQPIVLRWTLYYALILGIVIFGAYGPGYIPVAPIYADF